MELRRPRFLISARLSAGVPAAQWSTDKAQTAQPAQADTGRWASGINVLVGLWLVASPFVLAFETLEIAVWNDVAVGIAVAAVAAVRLLGLASLEWIGWLNILLGVWLITSPFVLAFETFVIAMWNNVIAGVIIAAIAAYTAYTEQQRRRRAA